MILNSKIGQQLGFGNNIIEVNNQTDNIGLKNLIGFKFECQSLTSDIQLWLKSD